MFQGAAAPETDALGRASMMTGRDKTVGGFLIVDSIGSGIDEGNVVLPVGRASG